METVAKGMPGIQCTAESHQASLCAINALSAQSCSNPVTGGEAVTPPVQFLSPGLSRQPLLTVHGYLVSTQDPLGCASC